MTNRADIDAERSRPRNEPETPDLDNGPMEDHRLSGFTVGITADRRWEEQAELLRRRGACVIHGPSIRTLPIGPRDGAA